MKSSGPTSKQVRLCPYVTLCVDKQLKYKIAYSTDSDCTEFLDVFSPADALHVKSPLYANLKSMLPNMRLINTNIAWVWFE